MSLFSSLLSITETKEKNEPLCFEAVRNSCSLSIGTLGDIVYPNLLYSVDELVTWNTMNSDTKINLSIGDRVYIKGNNPNGLSKGIDNYVYFFIPDALSCSGNVMSLLGEYVKDIPNEHCFAYLFQLCWLTNFPELPATKLKLGCYYKMFYYAMLSGTNLKLPALTLEAACYFDMFSLAHLDLFPLDKLPATTLADYCYYGMFSFTNIISVPINLLPATTLASGCYSSMFQGCTSLVDAPKLPATTLANNCYNFMFYGCTSLVNAPVLPATTLADECYRYMFKNCSKLNYIKALFLNTSSETIEWVSNVSSTGTFVKNVNAVWNIIGENGVPSGWNIEYNLNSVYCTSLTILEADDVDSYATTTKIKYKAIVNGTDDSGNYITGVELIGLGISDAFALNNTTSDITRTITFTYLGLTATTTIIQKAKNTAKSYKILLNNEWRLSSIINPDSSLYNGVYESNSNYNVSSGVATMLIKISGYTTFLFYIRSNAESIFDYVSVGVLDNDSFTYGQYSNTSVIKAHTRGNQKTGTSLSDYTLVTFDNIDGGEHIITIKYGKDGSVNSGDDRGYVLIPKNQ